MLREKQKEIFHTVDSLRTFESQIAEVFQQGKIHGPVHFSYGNEDYLIDLFQYVNQNDWVFSTWRNHYHALLHGVPEAELRDKIMQGHSISFQSPEHHFFTSAIVNGILPIAVGTAMGIKWKNDELLKERDDSAEKGVFINYKPDTRMVWCFVGDMAAESGIFYEALKYSIRNSLPIHFVVEDNGLSTNTPTQKSWGTENLYGFITEIASNLNAEKFWMRKYVSYFKYKREKYAHQGTGVWVNF